MAIMAEMASAICVGVGRSIQYFHMPVPRDRTDDAYFAPLENLRLYPQTELYLGLVHHDDAQGDAARLRAARRYARVDGRGNRMRDGARRPFEAACTPCRTCPRS